MMRDITDPHHWWRFGGSALPTGFSAWRFSNTRLATLCGTSGSTSVGALLCNVSACSSMHLNEPPTGVSADLRPVSLRAAYRHAFCRHVACKRVFD